MMSFLFTLAAFIVAIGVLVTVHEFGHYWVAKRNGVKILKFSIGFGRPLLKWVRGEDKTEYIIAAIPLGGYVKMLGEGGDVEVTAEEKFRAFNNKNLKQRTAIVAAGPVFNLVFAMLIYWLLFTGVQMGYTPKIASVESASIAQQAGLQDGDTIVAVANNATSTWSNVFAELKPYIFEKRDVSLSVLSIRGDKRDVSLSLKDIDVEQESSMEDLLGLQAEIPAIVGEIVADSAASESDLQPGDRILEIDGSPVSSPALMSRYIRDSEGKAVQLTILRNNQQFTLTLRPRLFEGEGEQQRWLIGVRFRPQPDVEYEVGIMDGLVKAGREVWDMSYLTLNMFYRMAIGEASLKHLSGPVTIAEYAGKTASISGESFLFFLAIVSISLGVINLLPIPLLDGGHLMYYLIEAVKGSPVSEEAMLVGQKIGIVVLLLIMSIAISNDIQRILN